MAYVPRLGAVIAQRPGAPARVLGIAVGRDDRDSAAEFQQEANFPYPTGIDADRSVRAEYRISRVPTLVLVGPDGQVLRTYTGGRDELVPALDAALEALGKGAAVPAYDLEGGG